MSPYHIKESEVYVFPTVSFLATTIELPRLKKIYKHSPAEDNIKKKKNSALSYYLVPVRIVNLFNISR